MCNDVIADSYVSWVSRGLCSFNTGQLSMVSVRLILLIRPTESVVEAKSFSVMVAAKCQL